MQKRVLALFHFALRDDGHLFLGSAETVSGQEDLFRAVSKKWRIFRRIGPTRHDVVDFPLVGVRDGGRGHQPEATAAPGRDRPRPRDLMDRVLLERHAPASALIGPSYRTLYLRGPTEGYLRAPSGEPSYNLLAMVRDGLQAPLRIAVRKAVEGRQEVVSDARVLRGDAFHPVRLTVTPLAPAGSEGATLLVSFFERAGDHGPAPPAEREAAADESRLQAELDSAREDLRTSMDHMEASNEELETSKEELQSLNEELNTVNNQLQAKVGEFERRTDDLNNLLNSTDIATLFLDRELRIRWFTPTMKHLLELLPSDLGRPISHFAQRFSGGDLLEDTRRVLERLIPSELEVVSDDGRWYIRRVVPYRTGQDRIEGVAVTFTDITGRKRAEEGLRESEERLRKVVEIDHLGVLFFDQSSGTLLDANDVFLDMTGYTRQEVEARQLTWHSLTPPEWVETSLEQVNKLEATGRIGPYEKEYIRKDGSRAWMRFSGASLGDGSLVEYCADISDRRRGEDALREPGERFRELVEPSVLTVWDTSVDGAVEADSPSWRVLTGQTFAEWSGHGWLDAVHPEDRTDAARQWRETVAGRAVLDAEFRLRTAAGAWRWTNLRAVPLLLREDGSVRRWLGMNVDISQRKQAEADRELLTRELSHRVKNILAVVQSLAMQTDGRVPSVEHFREAFVGRLQALARAHGLLLDAHWRSADLETLVGQAVAAYRVDHPEVIEVGGDPVILTPRHGWGSAWSSTSSAPTPPSTAPCRDTTDACGFPGRSKPAGRGAGSGCAGMSGMARGSSRRARRASACS